jgi:chromosome segregation ATPase
MANTINQDGMGDNKPRRQQASTGGSAKDSAAEIAALQAQLREKEELLQAKDTALQQLEQGLTARLYDLENRLREKDELLLSRDAELRTHRSKEDSLLEELTQIRTDKDRMSLENDKLQAELKEKKLRVAKLEQNEWHSIRRRNSLKQRFGRLGKFLFKLREDELNRDRTK